MNDEISPEIAELLAQTENSRPGAYKPPSFELQSLDVEVNTDIPPGQKDIETIDLSVKSFEPITEFFSTTKNPIFDDPTYYKVALSGENESSQKLHNLLSKYLTCQDPKDRTVYRQQMVVVYWEFIKSLAPKMKSSSIPLQKKLLLRYALVLPSLFTQEQKDLFATAFIENKSGEPVYYLDEWFKDIASGIVTLSATDEARPAAKKGVSSNEANHLMQLQSKNSGKLQNAESMLTAKESSRSMIESELKSRIEQLCTHPDNFGLKGHKEPLTEIQKKMATDINDRLRTLLKIDKEIAAYIEELKEAQDIALSLQSKLDSSPECVEVNTADINTELDTVKQMAKMTVGRQGNHFPIYTREFYHCTPRLTGFRENVLSIMAWIESIDPGVFCRTHKNAINRIVPYVILIPTYGDTGFCWEPFDKYNRVTSRGRVVVPMYPRNLQTAILTAVADLRWQVAKEKASYYWMEEGLTGQYYQWFASQKLKGDLKDYFINDYVLWITKESEGVQRLEKEVRSVFWRHIPFSQEIKEKLKIRSLVYQELYQRDINRSMSDGY